MNWCGSALALDTPARTPVTLSAPAPGCNGSSGKNGPLVGISNIKRSSTGSDGCETLSRANQKFPEENGHDSRVPIDTYLIPSELTENPVESVISRGHEKSSDDIDAESCNFKRANSSDAQDCDSDISITDVTNELLSLTYHDETKNNNEQTDLKSTVEVVPVVSEQQEGRLSLANLNSANDQLINANLSVKSLEFQNDSVIQSQLNSEEPDLEDDVRSLYPDVVVISSSEEEVHSRRSSITDSASRENFNYVHVESLETKVSSEDDVLKNHQPAAELEIETEATQSKPVIIVPISPIVNASEDKSESKSEVVNALRKSSFVDRLEKIIGAQTLKFSPASHPPIPKSMTLSPEVNFSHSENVSSDSAGFVTSHTVASGCPVDEHDSDVHLSSESISEKPCASPDTVPSEPSSETEWDGTNDPEVVKDIKERLEKIFSSNINSPVTSPMSKAFSATFAKPSEGDDLENEQAHESCVVTEDNVILDVNSDENSPEKIEHILQKEETRKHMAQVLGTIRLRNPDISSC